jgi:hypothetical protein
MLTLVGLFLSFKYDKFNKQTRKIAKFDFGQKNVNQSNRNYNMKPKNSNTVTCPNIDPDAGECPTAKGAVGNVDNSVSWQASAMLSAVNAFIVACKATQCKDACKTLVNNKDLSQELSGYQESFATSCAPETAAPTGEVTGCSEPLDNEEDCSDAYDAVLTKIPSTATGTWTAADIVTAINGYITKCPTTSCKETCKPVISQKNVGARYSSLRSNFEAECNPVAAVIPEDSSFKGIKASFSLIGISLVVAIGQLLRLN